MLWSRPVLGDENSMIWARMLCGAVCAKDGYKYNRGMDSMGDGCYRRVTSERSTCSHRWGGGSMKTAIEKTRKTFLTGIGRDA